MATTSTPPTVDGRTPTLPTAADAVERVSSPPLSPGDAPRTSDSGGACAEVCRTFPAGWTVQIDLTEDGRGGPDRGARIHATRADGATVGFHKSYGARDVADQFVSNVRDVLPDAARAVYLAEARDADSRDRADRALGALQTERARVRKLLHGGRFFGRVLVVLSDDGAVWVQDPEKRDAGMGFRFESLADLWRTWPDIRPVSWQGGDMICESFAIGGLHG